MRSHIIYFHSELRKIILNPILSGALQDKDCCKPSSELPLKSNSDDHDDESETFFEENYNTARAQDKGEIRDHVEIIFLFF